VLHGNDGNDGNEGDSASMASSYPTPITMAGEPERINPALYLDRELSWIAFNQRVLEEAQDPRNPLLERVKFLAIFSSNLDEFFMIRVSGLKKQLQSGVNRRAPSGLLPSEQFHAVRVAILPQLAERERLFHDELRPALHQAGIRLLHYHELNARQREAADAYFERAAFPVLTPLAIDAGHPFPFISNLSVNLLIELRDANGDLLLARVKVPESLPRLLPLSYGSEDSEADTSMTDFVWLEDVIAAHLTALFPGKTIEKVSTFRVTRDTDLEIQEDEASDLLETVGEGVRERTFGTVVRLTLDHDISPASRQLLMTKFELTPEDIYLEDGPLRLSSLMELYQIARPELKYPNFVPSVPAELSEPDADLFAAIRTQDILLQHPFDSFTPIIDLLNAAALDEHVLTMKQTLY